uniref:Uncharacterized protein n=1 Tax=Romanomermis culicivorax TaxID=13658 RepID=A0A915JA55_ROMCU
MLIIRKQQAKLCTKCNLSAGRPQSRATMGAAPTVKIARIQGDLEKRGVTFSRNSNFGEINRKHGE